METDRSLYYDHDVEECMKDTCNSKVNDLMHACMTLVPFQNTQSQFTTHLRHRLLFQGFRYLALLAQQNKGGWSDGGGRSHRRKKIQKKKSCVNRENKNSDQVHKISAN